jgi:divalent metal cation (Fe/Co/Zn/Cd) transporter
MPPAFSWPVWTSLLANIALFSVKLACFLRARSLAVAASLLDSTLDLLAQCLLAVAAALGERPDPRFPVGARRLEAAAVIVVAAVFAVGAAEVATECVSRLARGASAPVPELKNTDLALLSGVVAAKLALFAACVAFMKAERRSQRLVSPSIKALAADHAADALTNGVALLAAFGASGATFGKKGERNRNRRSTLSRLADPLGGLVIAVAVFFGWGVQAWDHVSKLVGKRASREVLEKIRDKVEERRRALVSSAGPPVRRSGDDALGETETESSETLLRHRRDEKTNENENGFVFELDSIRAYHGGERVVVEAEVVMCPETTLRESHDACLLLQQDLESMEEVERAFVHADYAKRFTPEHVWDAARLLNPGFEQS